MILFLLPLQRSIPPQPPIPYEKKYVLSLNRLTSKSPFFGTAGKSSGIQNLT